MDHEEPIQVSEYQHDWDVLLDGADLNSWFFTLAT